MANQYYTHATFPATGSAATSASMRAELDLITAGFDKLPTLTGNAGKLVVVNGSATGLIASNTIQHLDFNTAGGAGAVARLIWNDTDGTLDLGLKGGNVTLQLGQETVLRCLNNTGTPMTDLQAVYINSSSGQRPTIALARADAEVTSTKVLGVVTEPIANNAEGFVTTEGLVRNVNTLALTQGAVIWLSPSVAGGLTTTKPTAPNHSVMIGYCVRSHGTQGIMYVKVQNGYELDELHDVYISSVANNNMLRYVSANSRWENIAGPAGAVVGTTDSQTLTNKTISGASNTLSNIGNGSLVNSSLTIGSTNIALGGTAASLAGLTSVTATTFIGAFSGTATTATNLAGGIASQIPYQSAAGTTAFIANGTAGQVLRSNGTSAPSWGSNTVTIGSTGIALGATSTTLAGLTAVTSTAVTVSGLTANRVVFTGASGALSASANLTWDGTALGVTGALTVSADSSFDSTGALRISRGATADRPAGLAGMLRFNTSTSEFEGYNGTAWASVGGSAISNDTTTASDLYPIFVNATTGTAANVYTSNAKYLYKPSTGELQAPEVVANNGMFVNSATVTTTYSIPAGSNAMSAGPVSVASGITVTVPSGSTWAIA